ncbi:MAG: hypothetical protein ACC656_11360, partial [Candidatus Heimdallarchaeota archaeon]
MSLTYLSYSDMLGVDPLTDYYYWNVTSIKDFNFNSGFYPDASILTNRSNIELRITPPFPNLLESHNLNTIFSLAVDDTEIEISESDLSYILLNLLVTPSVGITANEENLDYLGLIDYYFMPKLTELFAIQFSGTVDVDFGVNEENNLYFLEIWNMTQYSFFTVTDFGLITQYAQLINWSGEFIESMLITLTPLSGRSYLPSYFDFQPDYNKFLNYTERSYSEKTFSTTTTTGSDVTSTPIIDSTATQITTGDTGNTIQSESTLRLTAMTLPLTFGSILAIFAVN